MKASTQIVIFFIAFNAVAGMFAASGLWGATGVGISPDTSSPEQLQEAQATYDNVSASGSGCQTFICTTINLAGNVRAAYSAILPGVAMLNDIGVPPLVTGMGTAVIGFLIGRDLIVFLLNR